MCTTKPLYYQQGDKNNNNNILHNASCHEEEWGTNGQISLSYKPQYQIMISNQNHFLVTSHLGQELPTPSEQKVG